MDDYEIVNLAYKINKVLVGSSYNDGIAALCICLSTVIEAAGADHKTVCQYLEEAAEYSKTQLN